MTESGKYIIYKQINKKFTYWVQLEDVLPNGLFEVRWTGLRDNAYEMSHATMQKLLHHIQFQEPTEKIFFETKKPI